MSTTNAAHKQQIRNALQRKLDAAGGCISFAEFMQFALYEPGLGYYVSGNYKLGSGGDFTTAPLISPLFAACLGNHCAGGKNILEFGAGTGHMACGILQRLAELDALPEHYFILEVSPELQQRQQQHSRLNLPAFIFKRMRWLHRLPTQFDGIMLANEVIDAMPVERICWQNGSWQQQWIGYHNEQLHTSYQAIEDPRLKKAVAALPQDLPEGYTTEINTWIEPWIQSLAHALRSGRITLIDYGFLRDTYYHPQRHMGTLKCHYQQKAHDNPLQHIGLQDITAHVDFTTIGESAETYGLEVSDFRNQAQFLIDCGLTELLSQVTDRIAYEKLLPGIQQLTSPNEMGELFKVMCLQQSSTKKIGC